MKKILMSLILLLLIVIITACSSDNGEEASPVFKIGAIPDQEVTELNRRFGEISDYLSQETGLTVEYVASQDYAALVTAFERGEIQLAWFGGLTGIQARSVVPGSEAIAQRPQDKEFTSVFIVQSDMDADRLEDLKGLSFTFGSESSTSGHLMPRHFLIEAGIQVEEDFDGKPSYSGSHDKTYKLIESGAFQAGALNQTVWDTAVADGKVDTSKVKVAYVTPPYYDYNWTINNVDETYGEGTKEKVKAALLATNSEQNEFLEFFKTDTFIETNNENYIAIEEVAKELGIIK